MPMATMGLDFVQLFADTNALIDQLLGLIQSQLTRYATARNTILSQQATIDTQATSISTLNADKVTLQNEKLQLQTQLSAAAEAITAALDAANVQGAARVAAEAVAAEAIASGNVARDALALTQAQLAETQTALQQAEADKTAIATNFATYQASEDAEDVQQNGERQLIFQSATAIMQRIAGLVGEVPPEVVTPPAEVVSVLTTSGGEQWSIEPAGNKLQSRQSATSGVFGTFGTFTADELFLSGNSVYIWHFGTYYSMASDRWWNYDGSGFQVVSAEDYEAAKVARTGALLTAPGTRTVA